MSRVATADRPLTVKQQKFANGVVAGKAKAKAHRDAGYAQSPPGYEMSDRRKAAELAQRPNVAAEIRRQVWLTCPPLDATGLAGMRAQAIRVIADLSRTAKSEAIRLKAAGMLYQIAETMRAASAPTATDAEQDKLLGTLRGLYRQIEGAAANAPDLSRPLAPIAPDAGDVPIDITTLEVIDDAKSD